MTLVFTLLRLLRGISVSLQLLDHVRSLDANFATTAVVQQPDASVIVRTGAEL